MRTKRWLLAALLVSGCFRGGLLNLSPQPASPRDATPSPTPAAAAAHLDRPADSRSHPDRDNNGLEARAQGAQSPDEPPLWADLTAEHGLWAGMGMMVAAIATVMWRRRQRKGRA